jgi:hypothetical protein
VETSKRKITEFVPISYIVDQTDLTDLNYADISNAGHNFKDLTGVFFGNLFVLGPSRKVKKYGESLWMFYAFCCTCGENVVEREAKQLSRKSTKSCGCIRFLQFSKDKILVAKNASYQKYVARSVAPNKNIDIDKDVFYKFFEKECFYCGAKPDLKNDENFKNKKLKLTGVDRIDNSIGYVESNLVACCFECNWMKQDYNQRDFIGQLWKIRKNLDL